MALSAAGGGEGMGKKVTTHWLEEWSRGVILFFFFL